MNLKEALSEYYKTVDNYNQCDFTDGMNIVSLMKDLSVILSFLAHQKSIYHDKWVGVTLEESSVAAGERKANKEVPELYHLRVILNTGYRILDTMRSNISYLKSEQG